MKAVCPRCRQTAAAADIDIGAMSARCRDCQRDFPLTPAPAPIAAGDDAPPGNPAAHQTPARFKVDRDGPRDLAVSWRWWRRHYGGLVLWCVMWDGFLSVWLVSVVFNPHHKHDLMSLLFPLPHLAVGIGVTYFLVAAACNRSTVTCDGERLTVGHGPLPWLGNRDLPLRELKEMRVVRGSTSRSGSTVQVNFNLVAIHEHRSIKLIGGLNEDEAAWLLARLGSMAVR